MVKIPEVPISGRTCTS